MNYDLIVIGGGSGGTRAARLAAQEGLKVALFEGYRQGGTCVIRGCVPKKMLKEASKLYSIIDNANRVGWNASKDCTFNIKEFMKLKDTEIDRISGFYEANAKKAGVEIINKFVKFVNNSTLSDGEQEYSAKNILITSGSTPIILPIEGTEHLKVSDDFLSLTALPKSICIIGGGYIGLEFASIANSLGIKTTLFIKTGDIIENFDQDIKDHVRSEMESSGINFIPKEDLIKVVKNNDETYSIFTNQNNEYKFDYILSAVGRRPNTTDLGLNNTSIELDKAGAIKVNDYFETTQSGVYALGDVINKVNLTPVAIKQAHFFVDNIVHGIKKPFDYDYIPTAVFCSPEVGSIGLSEQDARAKYQDIEVCSFKFRSMKYVVSKKELFTLVKLIVDKKSNRVVGLHGAGDDVAEMMQGFAIAMKMGATKKDFDNTIALHPSSSEEFVLLK